MIHFYDRRFPADGRPLRHGVEKAIHGLARALAAAGHAVTVLSEQGPSGDRSQFGYTVRAFPRDGALRPSARLREYMLLAEPGVVVLNGMFHPALIQMASLLRGIGRPYIVAPHSVYNDALFARSAMRKQLFWHIFERRMLQGAASVQHLDPRHAAFLTARGVTSAWFSLPNGFPDEALDRPWSKLLPHGRPARLLHYGRLDLENKGLDFLIAAVAARPDCSLTLQGPDSGDNEALRRMADALGIGSRVTLLEPETGLDPGEVIGAYDALCLTSRWEGFGLSALEAMLAARPVLITDTGGLVAPVRESDCGAVCAPTASGVAAGLTELMTRRAEWPEMGLRGRERVADTLAWSVIAQEAALHYEAAVRIGRRAADRDPRPVPRRSIGRVMTP